MNRTCFHGDPPSRRQPAPTHRPPPADRRPPTIVSLNFAIGADGKITGARRDPGPWTSPADQQRLLELRLGADALLVGRGTLEADSMSLAFPAGHPGAARQPLRCAVSRTGRFDPAHRLFHTPGGPVHLLVTGPDAPPAELAARAAIHRATLPEFLAILRRDHGVRRIHCEGGGQLARELFALDLIDTVHLTWAAHTLFGGRDAPGITGPPGAFLPASRHFRLEHFEPSPETGECFLTYRRRADGEADSPLPVTCRPLSE